MNNRQSGRRRGRNNNSNNRSQSGGRGGVDQANRIDSRARGNAVQMIEKYKNLARDAQLSGDRVQTEYYLQFADHYFRVHSDFRARQEERAAQSGQERSPDRHREVRGVEDFDGHDESDLDSDGERTETEQDGETRGNRDRRDDEDGRGNRQPRARGRRERDQDRSEAGTETKEGGSAERETPEDAPPAPRTARRGPRRTREREEDAGETAGIDSAALPPAIGRSERNADAPAAGDGAEEAPAPKPRRTRRTLAARDTGVEAAE